MGQAPKADRRLRRAQAGRGKQVGSEPRGWQREVGGYSLGVASRIKDSRRGARRENV